MGTSITNKHFKDEVSLCHTFVALASVVLAKDELQASDCGGGDSILTLGSLTDLKSSGPIDHQSILKIIFSASKDTHSKDPFDVDHELEVKKKVAFWYVKVPQAIMDQIGKSIHSDEIKYLGRSVFRVDVHSYICIRPAILPKVLMSQRSPWVLSWKM